MMPDQRRLRLKKLLGKTCIFTGTRSRIEDNRILLVNIYYKNKLVKDHIWCSITDNNKTLKYNEELSFKATVESYTDSFNNRKYGLERIHKFQPLCLIEEQNNIKQKNKRLHK